MVTARQSRPWRSSKHDDVAVLERDMKTCLRVWSVRGDNPPGTFRRWQDFYGDWHEWSPREEADWVRWSLMEDGMSYDDAEAEMRAVTTLLQPQPLTPAQEARSGLREPGAPDARREAA